MLSGFLHGLVAWLQNTQIGNLNPKFSMVIVIMKANRCHRLILITEGPIVLFKMSFYSTLRPQS